MTVYFLKNKASGKIYIGATRGNYLHRVRAHLGRYHMRGSQLSKDIGRLGKENFEYGVVANCVSLEDLQHTERENIENLPVSLRYNRNIQGIPMLSGTRAAKIRTARTGKNQTQATKDKISKSKIGKNIWPNGRPIDQVMPAVLASARASSKRVKCIETNKIFRSLTEAAREMGLSKSGISGVCLMNRKKCRGYTFKYLCKE